MAPRQFFKRILGYLNVPHVTLFLVVGQALVFFLANANPEAAGGLYLVFDDVRKGQVWRLLTGPFVPSTTNILFAAINLWFFYVIGTSLEREWDNARYNLYLLVGYVAIVLASAIYPHNVFTFDLLGLSLFLAFAQLFPRLIIYMIVLPVEARWLGVAAWIYYGYIFAAWPAPQKVAAGASLVNFLIFFVPALLLRLRGAHRSIEVEGKRAADAQIPFHVCRTCGITDKTDPQMEFFYCPLCVGSPGYCANHIHNHAHIT